MCDVFGEGLRIRGKKFKQNLYENGSKRSKMVITVRKFSKIFWESMLPDPPKVVFVPRFCSKNDSAEKITLNKCQNL